MRSASGRQQLGAPVVGGGVRLVLDGSGPNGVLVSPYVASGGLAKGAVSYGFLKPGVLYALHSSAYDGSKHETTWSPWAYLRIDPYMTFPAPQTSSTIDTTAPENIEFTRTDPGPALPTLDANGAVKREATQPRRVPVAGRTPRAARSASNCRHPPPSRWLGRRKSTPRCCAKRQRRRPAASLTAQAWARPAGWSSEPSSGSTRSSAYVSATRYALTSTMACFNLPASSSSST